ncbi:MAG: SDR family oxidoreductase [Pseudomonadota bacterium]
MTQSAGATNNLSGKRAVVFGGSSGIGLATVQQLSARGVSVTAVSRNPERAANDVPDGVKLAACDTRDIDALGALFAELAADGPIDLLINCATGGKRAAGPFLEMDLDGYRGSFDKLWGYANTVRVGAAHLADDAGIVLVTGSPAQRAKPGQSALASVGGAIEAFCRALAPELAPRRINCVSPGVTDTPMFGPDAEARGKMLGQATAKHLLPRPVSAAEIADAILLCAGNAMMTGGVINVDGGWILGQ